MNASDIRWNEPARAKILDDADGVLRRAVLDVAKTSDISSDDAFAELNARLKDHFIDYEPGPDIRTYADAIAAGEFAEKGDDVTSADAGTTPDAHHSDDAGSTPNAHHSDDAEADSGPPTDAFADEVRADAADAQGNEKPIS